MNDELLLRTQTSIAKRITARLQESADSIPHDVSERLRVARLQAIAKHKELNTQIVTGMNVSGGIATLQGGSSRFGIWNQMASWLPLMALIAGLMTIGVLQEDNRVLELAAVDTELLTDELPPSAYTDPGFIQFLRSSQQD
jgi:hypothetical protein